MICELTDLESTSVFIFKMRQIICTVFIHFEKLQLLVYICIVWYEIPMQGNDNWSNANILETMYINLDYYKKRLGSLYNSNVKLKIIMPKNIYYIYKCTVKIIDVR